MLRMYVAQQCFNLSDEGMEDALYDCKPSAASSASTLPATPRRTPNLAAPPSTKNQTGKRDPEMHQSKKGNQWYFGMKAHWR